MDAATTSQDFEIPYVTLLNDLAANAYGIPQLAPSDFAVIQEGDLEAEGNRCVVSPDTGLGEAGLFGMVAGIMCGPARGGHSISRRAMIWKSRCWNTLITHYGHVSNERVVSGMGIENIYNFLRDTGRGKEVAENRARNEGRAIPAASFRITR